jgi:S-(hydroxymethyl)glutathione dehydrogenase/alcohol dehydrogenase
MSVRRARDLVSVTRPAIAARVLVCGRAKGDHMRAAVLREIPGELTIEELRVDKPRPREVLVRTVAAGVCHSDLHHLDGSLQHAVPVVMGHESAGIVEAVGSEVTDFVPGDPVVSCLSVFCGHCEMCLTGHPYRCFKDPSGRGKGVPSRLTRTDGATVHQFYGVGGFAEEMLVSEHAVVKITPDIPLDRAALLGCGVMTGLGAVFRTARVEPGSTVAVVGAGGVGLAAIQGARIAGAARVIAVDRVADKLTLAEQLGATDSVNAADGDPVEQVQELTGGGVDYAFEAIGNPVTVRQCFSMAKRGGFACVIGLLASEDTVTLTGRDISSLKIFTSTAMGGGSFRVDIPRYADMYLRGVLDLDSMVSARLPIDGVNDAFTAMKAGEVARSVLTFDD